MNSFVIVKTHGYSCLQSYPFKARETALLYILVEHHREKLFSYHYVDTLALQKLVSSMAADSLDPVCSVGKVNYQSKADYIHDQLPFVLCFAALDDVENLLEVFWNKTGRIIFL